MTNVRISCEEASSLSFSHLSGGIQHFLSSAMQAERRTRNYFLLAQAADVDCGWTTALFLND